VVPLDKLRPLMHHIYSELFLICGSILHSKIVSELLRDMLRLRERERRERGGWWQELIASQFFMEFRSSMHSFLGSTLQLPSHRRGMAYQSLFIGVVSEAKRPRDDRRRQNFYRCVHRTVRHTVGWCTAHGTDDGSQS
jgi:hypothetical protein